MTLTDNLLRTADMLGHIVPLLVVVTSLWQAARTRGVSRWLCAYIAVFSMAMLGFLLTSGGTDPLSHILVLGCAWLTLPLWLFMRRTGLVIDGKSPLRRAAPLSGEARQGL